MKFSIHSKKKKNIQIHQENESCSLDKKDVTSRSKNDIGMRDGDGNALAETFIKMTEKKRVKLKHDDLKYPHLLKYENVLAVHYADGGAQGEAGALRILYRSPYGIQILYGNYIYGDLDLDDVIQTLPMLKPLDSRFSFGTLPYPFGGNLDIPDDWSYLYMGAMNHYYVRREIGEEAKVFIEKFLNDGRNKWYIFEAIAWLYGMEPIS